ncbi:MAG: alpha/beta fold hydrolase [Burkholderiaceae bacterium]
MLGPNPFIGLRPETFLEAYRDLLEQATLYPTLAMEETAALVRELMAVYAGSSILAPEAGDKRFTGDVWRDNPFYRITLQSYLAWSTSLRNFIDRSSLEADNKARAHFVFSSLTDAFAPTNTLLGNPDALKKTIETRGENLLAGFRNYISDLVKNDGLPSQVDKAAFKVGGNLAVSPGEVVFRSPILELIQYAPATKTVHARPHLFVAPEVNKFYVFDLAPGKSMIEYLLDSGFQVFAISWRNPKAEHRDWGMDAYVTDLLAATDAIRDITGSDDLIMHAACSGGMTAVSLAGYLAAKRDPRLHALTLLVASFDMTDSTPGLFATPRAVAAAKAAVNSKGILSSAEMSRGFALMRPREAIWNYWVNNYLMGNDPPAADLFYWANDATSLPAKFYCDMMDLVANGLLLEPGGFTVLGKPIDISEIQADKYLVAGTTDHIMPWKGVYKAAQHFGGHTEFVLSAAGHIQSLISPPPGHVKAKFFLNPDLTPAPDQWLKDATRTAGSWWPHWQAWLAARSGERRSAPTSLGSKKWQPLGKAPGTYVHE